MQTSKLPIHLAMMEQLKSKQGKLRFRFRFGSEPYSVLAQNNFKSVNFSMVQIGKQFYRVQAITDYTTEPLMNMGVQPKNTPIVSSAKAQSTQVPVVEESLPLSQLFALQQIRVVAPQMKGLSVLATEVVTIIDDMRIMKAQPILQPKVLIDNETSYLNETIGIIETKTVSQHYTTEAINVIDYVMMAKAASIAELVQLYEQESIANIVDDTIETIETAEEIIEQNDENTVENLAEDIQSEQNITETVDNLEQDEVVTTEEVIEQTDENTVEELAEDVQSEQIIVETETIDNIEQDEVVTTEEVIEQTDENTVENLAENVQVEQNVTEIVDSVEQDEVVTTEEIIEQTDENTVENLAENVQVEQNVTEIVDSVEQDEVVTTEEVIKQTDENTVEELAEDIQSEQIIVETETIDNVEQDEVVTTEEVIEQTDENTVENLAENVQVEQNVTEIVDSVEQDEVVTTEEIIEQHENIETVTVDETIAETVENIEKDNDINTVSIEPKQIERTTVETNNHVLEHDKNAPSFAMVEQSLALISTQKVESEMSHQSTLKKCAKVGGILLAFAVLNIWVMQRSVNAYYLQTYHQPSPLVKLDDFALWSAGGKIGNFLYAQHDALTSSIQQANQQVVDNFNQNHAFTAEYLAEQEQKRQAQLAQLKLEQEKQAKEQLAQRYVLTPNDKIFFAGDSMMQGVAPHVQQYLQKHNIQSINLSKQSTGLSYPSFFDWPKTIEQTLQQNPDIKILAVFLGPNDPWNMVHPQTKQLLKFASLEWQTEYQSRMLRILNVAKQHKVSVIWLTSPNMKDDKLNRQMIDLNKIINDELSRHDDVLAIDTRALLGSQNDVYNDYLVKDGQSIKMRTGDGVHFTPQGQKNVAQALQQHLTIMP